ncbi:hypothetical protein E4191_07545 [Paracoccus liaowanqingii]|uniref:LamG domain-containing protein n=1 Tax=Paracoccus liaowanqingii TaxID=2560053 RepID=A0A4P7HK87_9RHOB|nr:hypothetical protein [Paracoccus liaowanqingii]QBX34579.1 hypothetical protein E4191_07545 [Paracoccus liaowanqingii]
MRIMVPGIDASQSGLGRATPTVRGMPADDLAALYLFESGQEGEIVTTFLDSSGNDRHGALHGAYAGGVKRPWGLEITGPHGMVIATGVPITATTTILLAIESLVPGGQPALYQSFYSPSTNNLLTDPTAATFGAVSPMINFDGSVASGNFALFEGVTGLPTLGTARLPITGGPSNNQPTSLALKIDAPANTLELLAQRGTPRVVTRAGVGAHYGDGEGNAMLGMWWHGGARPSVTPVARLFGAAIYHRVLDGAELQMAMAALRRPAENAGIVFAL